MRYAKGHREETRARIVETASRLFQEKGVDRVGVDEIMRESGLTHGGFYVHFKNKGQLIAEACARAVDERADEWKVSLRGLPPEEAFAAFLDNYIECAESSECPFSSLGADVSRQGPEVRKAYTEKLEELLEFMVEELHCGREEALLALVAVSGAMNIANASNDPDFSKEIIATTRRNLVELWRVRCAPKVKAKAKPAKKARVTA